MAIDARTGAIDRRQPRCSGRSAHFDHKEAEDKRGLAHQRQKIDRARGKTGFSRVLP
jgi:hypothetical protein